MATNYLVDYLNLTNVQLMQGSDNRGIKLDMYLGSQFAVFFNRTLILRFEDPPYGQSLANRLVTNRNTDWRVNKADLLNNRYAKRADSRDLVYRYYHNLGHLFGFGHYRATDDQIDIRFIENRPDYAKYVRAIETTRLLLPAKWRITHALFKNYHIEYVNGRATLIPWSPNLLRSVMYAKLNDDKKAAGSPTVLDVYVLRYVMNNLFTLLEKFIGRFLVDGLSPLILQMISTFRYFV